MNCIYLSPRGSWGAAELKCPGLSPPSQREGLRIKPGPTPGGALGWGGGVPLAPAGAPRISMLGGAASQSYDHFTTNSTGNPSTKPKGPLK